MKDILVIGGATGVGKSDVAVACALQLNGEIISADSMQVYRGFDIGTAKIKDTEMAGVPHYMIDIADPNDTFTVADYKKRAIECVEDIKARGKLPIVCGGTGLYINSLLYQMSYSGKLDPVLRARLNEELAEKGKEFMHDKLSRLNPEAAMRLHVNDTKRVLRAIEKALTGGETENDFEKPLYSYKMYVMERARRELYERIDRRVDAMIENGLLDEVTKMIKSGVESTSQAMQAIAYKEWALSLSYEKTVLLIKKNTRNYAKRQITWFKQYKDAKHIEMGGRAPSEIAAEIVQDYKKDDVE